MTLQTAVVIGFTIAAVFFALVGAVGVLRLPDVYTRAHAAAKADTLGAGFAVAAVAAYFGFQFVSVKVLLLLVFIYITNPTASHAISRAAYLRGFPMWVRTEDGTGELVAPEAIQDGRETDWSDGAERNRNASVDEGGDAG